MKIFIKPRKTQISTKFCAIHTQSTSRANSPTPLERNLDNIRRILWKHSDTHTHTHTRPETPPAAVPLGHINCMPAVLAGPPRSYRREAPPSFLSDPYKSSARIPLWAQLSASTKSRATAVPLGQPIPWETTLPSVTLGRSIVLHHHQSLPDQSQSSSLDHYKQHQSIRGKRCGTAKDPPTPVRSFIFDHIFIP